MHAIKTTEWLGRHQYSRWNLNVEVLGKKMTGHGGCATVPIHIPSKLLDFSVT